MVLGLGQEMYKMSVGYLVVPEYKMLKTKQSKQKTHIDGSLSKWHQSQLKEDSFQNWLFNLEHISSSANMSYDIFHLGDLPFSHLEKYMVSPSYTLHIQIVLSILINIFKNLSENNIPEILKLNCGKRARG